MKVKICGITNHDDALAAAEAGADALGFIFVESSPRYIAPSDAQRIIKELPPFVTPVGVFVNSSREKILRTAHVAGIRAFQLHGDELPEETAGYPLPVIKAFQVGEEFDVSRLAQFVCSAFLLDTAFAGMRGGTGAVFDWRIAVEAKKFGRIILSGGLKPENICEAVSTARPHAIDVNSGVEAYPGKKDPAKLKALFSALRTMQEPLC